MRLLLLLSFTWTVVHSTASPPSCAVVYDSARVECTPDKPLDQATCLQRGCCWSPTTSKGPPSCYFGVNYTGYHVVSVVDDWNKLTVNLQRRGPPSGFVEDIKNVRLEATYLNDHSLRLRFVDADRQRFEIPFPKLNLPIFPHSFRPIYHVSVTPTNLLVIKRKSTGTVIFSTDLTLLVYSNQFHQLSSAIASERRAIYGLGEHKAPYTKTMNWTRYEIWNHGHYPMENMNMYGSHPFYLSVEDQEGNSHGVLLFNANAIDVLLQPQPAVTWRTIGGVFDFFLFFGPKPDKVIKDYVSLIGTPAMPPFWSLGFHLCRCCPHPHTIDEQKVITQRMIDAKIPFDVQWSAKEFFNDNFDMFTINNTRYPGFKQWIQEIQAKGMHWIPIIDPGIGVWPKGKYKPYDEGLEMDIFIKNSSGKVFYGQVWNLNNITVFPDFTHPRGMKYWIKQLTEWYDVVPFDGLWNDMNEISNRLNGSKWGCPNNSIEYPQYIPSGNPIQINNLCMTARLYAGIYYNVHDMYTLTEALTANLALREIRKKRPFILSRSSFIGQGKYAAHWDGDILSTYDHMRWTVPSIINFNMFGIPMIGADICGFMLGPQIKNDSYFQELCARWHEVGAFYPFSRNHNDKPVDQDPPALGPVVTDATRNALNIRYSLLPLLYTLLYRAEKFAEPVVRPLFFEYPTDSSTYPIETQFLWGSQLMVMPALFEGQRSVDAYFPAGRWYLYDINDKDRPIQPVDSEGETIALAAPIGKVNVAFRGGSIVASLPPMQTTTVMRLQSFIILVALDANGKAEGELYWDDGDSIDPIQNDLYTLVKFKAGDNKLIIEPTNIGYDTSIPLDTIRIFGIKQSMNIWVNEKAIIPGYDQKGQVLTVSNLSLDLRSKIVVVWDTV